MPDDTKTDEQPATTDPAATEAAEPASQAPEPGAAHERSPAPVVPDRVVRADGTVRELRPSEAERMKELELL